MFNKKPTMLGYSTLIVGVIFMVADFFGVRPSGGELMIPGAILAAAGVVVLAR